MEPSRFQGSRTLKMGIWDWFSDLTGFKDINATVASKRDTSNLLTNGYLNVQFDTCIKVPIGTKPLG